MHIPITLQVCSDKIAKKGNKLGLSFYAFFANKNEEPKLLMEVAQWWLMTHKLDYFENAVKIKQLMQQEELPFSIKAC